MAVCDVVVVGSGAGGLVAALRAKASGLDVVVIEKAHAYGGTSALSGGVLWIPNNGGTREPDSSEKAMTYLRAIVGPEGHEDRLQAYVDRAAPMIDWLRGEDVLLDSVAGWPDYFSDLPGANVGRSMLARTIDGADLGDALFSMRDQTFSFRLFDRYALSMYEAEALAKRPPGWKRTAAKVIARYWLDLPFRRKTRRDRKLTMGAALIGALRLAADRQGIPVWLNTSMTSLIHENGRVVGVTISGSGRPERLLAERGVIIASGGFEQSQALRDQYWPVPTDAKWSHTPAGGNTGDGLRAALDIGADTEFMEYGWWAPSMQYPHATVPNFDVTFQMFFDKHHPNSICVNTLGRRFVNECDSYDRFGQAMIADYKRTGGANVPCWMIFDATYRRHYTCGGLMPSTVTPDSRVPANVWDNYIFRADTIEALAAKIGVPADALKAEVERNNRHAAAGKDDDFDRGGTEYETYNAGDPRVRPNPCLGPIDMAPFYAVQVDLGDVGSKGGLKANAKAQVLDRDGTPIDGLYAIGNAAGSPFGNNYPGGGGTLGPATVFGFIAADHLVEQGQELGRYTHNIQPPS